MRSPALAILLLHPLQHIPEPGIEISKRLHPVRSRQNGVPELLVEDVLLDEIDQSVCFGVDVILVEQDLREL